MLFAWSRKDVVHNWRTTVPKRVAAQLNRDEKGSGICGLQCGQIFGLLRAKQKLFDLGAELRASITAMWHRVNLGVDLNSQDQEMCRTSWQKTEPADVPTRVHRQTCIHTVTCRMIGNLQSNLIGCEETKLAPRSFLKRNLVSGANVNT